MSESGQRESRSQVNIVSRTADKLYSFLFMSLNTHNVRYEETMKLICHTCRGRLSISERIPNKTSSRFVKVKALMALVSFWTFLSRLGTAVVLLGDKRCLYNRPFSLFYHTMSQSLNFLLFSWIHYILIHLTLLHLPIHDVANQRAGDQTQELHRAEDGRVKTHCKLYEDRTLIKLFSRSQPIRLKWSFLPFSSASCSISFEAKQDKNGY